MIDAEKEGPTVWWLLPAYWRMIEAMCQPLPEPAQKALECDQRVAVLDATAQVFAQLTALLERAHYVCPNDERGTIAQVQAGLATGQQEFLACRHRSLLVDVPVHLSAD